MKKASPLLLTLAALLCFASGCIRYEPELTEKDRETITQKMWDSNHPDDVVDVYLVYDKHDVPRFLLGVTPHEYMMFKRSDYSHIEGGYGRTPYDGYLDRKKYYSIFFCFCVFDEADPEAPYYSISTDRHFSDVTEALRAGKGS